MLTEYIENAMRRAHYEMMESVRFFGSIALCRGCWGEGATLEECRDELRGALECWILVGVQHGDSLPVIDASRPRRGRDDRTPAKCPKLHDS
jgi:predicted RNase H-like HicB family nuclease